MYKSIFLLIFYFILLKLYDSYSFLSSSVDNDIKFWDHVTVAHNFKAGENLVCLDADSNFSFIIACSPNLKFISWNASINEFIPTISKQIVANNLIALNTTHFLSTKGKILYYGSWTQNSLIKIYTCPYGIIKSMKLLKKDLIVILSTDTQRIMSFSLKKFKLIDGDGVNEMILDLDALDRSFIVGACSSKSICTYYLNSDSNKFDYVEKNIELNINQIVNTVKIINSSYVLLGLNTGELDGWEINPNKITYFKKNSQIMSNITCIEILDDKYFVTGHENGMIELWDVVKIKHLKTISNSSGYKIISIKNFTLLKTYNTEHSSSTDKLTTFITQSYIAYELSTEYKMTTNHSTIETLKIETSSTAQPLVSYESTTEYSMITKQSTIELLKTETMKQKKDFSFDENNLNKVLEILKFNLDISDCLINCSGNGKCKIFDDKKYECECFDNFAGHNCQINTLPCWSNPCRNNGTCVNILTNKTFLCECSPRNKTSLYFGKHCEYKDDLCQNETCSGNGVCYEDENKKKCKCFNSYNGLKCENESDEIKLIKAVIFTSSIVALVIILLTFFTFILINLTYLSKRRNFKIKQHYSKPQKLTYIN
ncbi:unnamed protein product [Brachionus calyciflorus]|uniref:EGF-like domain-containing protein n=1 Tax=Brachionus calyciflorus TaxID=104777 RepID=A0A814NTY4_9BILA|nr:unnamed protein product [Brachionus calyciflorus]